MSKVLLTGASGLLGSNIARELYERGYPIRIFARKGSNLSCLKDIHYELFSGDLLNADDVIKAAEGCSAVIHSAANTSQFPVNYRYYEDVNVNATLNIIRAVKVTGIQRYIHVSTANAFGFGTRKNPGTELSEFRAEGYNSGYMMSKYIAQQHVLRQVEKNNLPAIVVNPGFMLGPCDTRPSSGQIILTGLKKFIVCPEGGKSFIYVKDVSQAICNSLTLGEIGECYLLTHENLTFYEFFRLLNRIAGNKPKIIRAPSITIKTVGLAGSFFEFATRMPVQLNYINSKLLCHHYFYSSAKAIRELKLPQTPLSEALPVTLKWFVDMGYVKNLQNRF